MCACVCRREVFASQTARLRIIAHTQERCLTSGPIKRASQCELAPPDMGMSSRAMPLMVGQLKCSRANARTRGVTIHVVRLR
jgi:hypothetical protein